MKESEEVTRWSQNDFVPTTIEMRGLDHMKDILKECSDKDTDFYDAYLKDVNF
jgi:hypothetical protein